MLGKHHMRNWYCTKYVMNKDIIVITIIVIIVIIIFIIIIINKKRKIVDNFYIIL